MTKNMIKQAEDYVKVLLEKERSGHDYYHIERVRKLALYIAKKEKANLFIVEMAALLHDTVDEKLFDEETAYANLELFFNQIELPQKDREAIIHILKYMSFKGGINEGKLKSLEGHIVQDADRLDALGAIGIARTFQFAGKFGEAMYDPNIKVREDLTKTYREPSTAINHFYEKLFKLKDLMNTTTGKQLAEEKHAYMEQFIEMFMKEWNGIK